MIEPKSPERPPMIRYVIRNADKFYYDGHGEAAWGEGAGPHFNTRNELFAVKYGDLIAIEALFKNHKKWCIDADRPDLFDLFDKCEVVTVYT